MKNKRACPRLALLAGIAAIFATASADAASPRGPQETQVRRPPPATPVEMDAWLRRLVGRFRWEGVLDIFPQVGMEDGSDMLGVGGISDCIAIGSAAGVQCVLDVRWKELYTHEGEPLAVPNLTPAMSMFGIDAARERMLYLQVDNKGLPHGGPGSLVGSTADFRSVCLSTDPQNRVPAPPGQSMNGPGGQSDSGAGGGGDGADQGGTGPGGSGSAASGDSTSRYSPSLGRGEPASWMSCLWITHISAKPGSKVIHINISYGDRADPTNRFVLTLRRIQDPEQ